MRTQIQVWRDGDRHRTRLTSGALRGQRLTGGADRCRIALLGTTALLLGGDCVELDVEVGPGAQLDLSDVAGTVVYHGRGRPAGWHLRVRVAAGGSFRYLSEPLVVADGADLTRTSELDVDPGAVVCWRETVVLGRTGEAGGPVTSHSQVRIGAAEVWRETQVLDPVKRRAPGWLGSHRVLDSVLTLGEPAPRIAAPTYRLVDDAGTLTRWLGEDAAASPLHVLTS